MNVRRVGGGDDGSAMAAESSRRGRFYHHHDDGPGSASASVPVVDVDQAECTAQTCRSCVAVTLADAIAVGCCPCAVVSLLGLALVRAPLAVARRCLRQMRRRWGELRHKKRVRDDMGARGPAAAAKCCGEALDAEAAWWSGGSDARGEVTSTWATRARPSRSRSSSSSSASASPSGRLDAEKVWMEMYRVGHWGFGRLSISVTSPPSVARPDGDGRKDVDLRCES